jgi:hypothetical protein
MSLFARVGALSALFCLCASSLHAQSLKWISHDPVPVSAGDRSYIARINQTTAFEEPGFEPLAVIPREDGAYVVVPVNGGSTSGQLASMLNPSWQRQRGFQILRLDAQGQVLWQRMWTQRFSYNGFSGPQELRLLDARLTHQGGLALLSDSAIYFDPEGAARQVSPRSPPPGCLPEGYSTDQVQSFLAADASLVVSYDRWAVGSSRACAFAPDGGPIDVIEAAPGLAMEALDFRAGVGFLGAHYVFDMGVYSQRTTRLRSGAQTRWSRIHAIDLRPQLAIAPDGSTWLREDGDLQVISPAGETLAQFSASDGAAPAAWLAGGDVLLANAGSLVLRRVSSLGLERWSRPADPQGGGDFARWFVLGDQVRALLHSSFSGRVRLPSFALADGALLSAPEFASGALVIGPLAGADHLVGLPSAFSGSWQRDPATCGTVCDPSALAVSPGLDLRVFDSASGALQAALDPGGFGFTTYARLRERGAGVVREFASENITHARYVSTGAKELLEVSRLDPRGSEVWRTRLEFERFDVHNAVLTVVDGETYVAASALGPGATEHWLWKLDAAGAVA